MTAPNHKPTKSGSPVGEDGGFDEAAPALPAGGSVTVWVERIKAGDARAATPLWREYFTRLTALARRRLRAAHGAADEEDVALAAFDSFCRGAGEGRFPRLDDRDDLWQVLFLLTTRKAVGATRHETRAKRGGGRVVSLSGCIGQDGAATGPSPDEAAEVAEECGRLLGLLTAGQLREVAVWKMEGDTNAEIAVKLGRSVPTVERKLADIRKIWDPEGTRSAS